MGSLCADLCLACETSFCHGHGPPAVGGCYCLCSSLFELKLGWKVYLYVRKTLVKFQLICNII